MEYSKLKNSDLLVSRICLGTWLFGGRRWGKVNSAECLATLERALDLGINFFDTADAYGEGIAEEMLGKVLNQKHLDLIVATKVGVVWRSDGARYIDLSPAHIQDAVRASLKRLKTDTIDLYQIHEMDPLVPIEVTGGALKELIKSGLVRYIGVSNFDPTSIRKLQEILPVVTIQSEYNLIRREIEADILPFCRQAGLSLLVYTPLQRGLLSGKFDQFSFFPEDDNRYHEKDFQGARFTRHLEKIEKLKEISRRIGRSPSQVAIRWLLEQRGVDAVICGARHPAQLTENAGATDWNLTPDSIRALSDLFQGEQVQ